jgi:hypothetical protein
MPKQVSEEIIQLFAEITGKSEGWFADEVEINRTVIEANTCPHCWKPLEYAGRTNFVIFQNFGICRACRFAKLFWTEGGELSQAKKRICERAKKRAAV